MANNINKVIVSGNLTRPGELRSLPSGSQVLELRIASNRKWKDKQTQQERTEVLYVDCTIFGNRGAALSQYLTKGKSVFIEGRLKLDEWQDKQTGAKRSKHRIVVDEIEFFDRAKAPQGGGQQQAGGWGQPQPQPQYQPQPQPQQQWAGQQQPQGAYAQPPQGYAAPPQGAPQHAPPQAQPAYGAPNQPPARQAPPQPYGATSDGVPF